MEDQAVCSETKGQDGVGNHYRRLVLRLTDDMRLRKKPAARGMVAVATAVVCTITFSSSVKPRNARYRPSALNSPNPRMADCSEPMVIQPVCRPK